MYDCVWPTSVLQDFLDNKITLTRTFDFSMLRRQYNVEAAALSIFYSAKLKRIQELEVSYKKNFPNFYNYIRLVSCTEIKVEDYI